jgi:hypothetical protein
MKNGQTILQDLFEGQLFTSLYDINNFPREDKEHIYLTLIPEKLITRFELNPKSLQNKAGKKVIRFYCPPGMGFVSIEVKSRVDDEDPVFSLDLETTNLSQVELSFLSFNDPFSERFNIDHDEEGTKNFLSTGRRNIKEEERALEAGLTPGQVRKGIGILRDFFKILENFLQALGCTLYLLEPLFYHNAVVYERLGCGYVEGKPRMEKIHQGFAPGGELFSRLNDSSPFRQRGFEKTVRGRSWAIHDGILPEPWNSPKMFKPLGENLNVSTFPDSIF